MSAKNIKWTGPLLENYKKFILRNKFKLLKYFRKKINKIEKDVRIEHSFFTDMSLELKVGRDKCRSYFDKHLSEVFVDFLNQSNFDFRKFYDSKNLNKKQIKQKGKMNQDDDLKILKNQMKIKKIIKKKISQTVNNRFKNNQSLKLRKSFENEKRYDITSDISHDHFISKTKQELILNNCNKFTNNEQYIFNDSLFNQNQSNSLNLQKDNLIENLQSNFSFKDEETINSSKHFFI